MLLIALAGCSGTEGRSLEPIPRDTRTAFLEVARTSARTPTTSISIAASLGRGRWIGGLQGTLSFDPTRYHYLGVAEGTVGLTIVDAREADRGRLQVLSVEASGLDLVTATLLFEGAADSQAFVYRSASVIEASGSEIGPLPVAATRTAPDIRNPIAIAPPIADLAELRASAPAANPVYGDITGDGRLTVSDVVVAANSAVGLLALAGDAFIAGNVSPANAPGLGEPGDLPPGAENGGAGGISVADVVAIARTAVGFSNVVVGKVIPAARVGPRFDVTPQRVDVVPMSPACQARVAGNTQWLDVTLGRLHPDCVGSGNRPMVIQFCLYQKTEAGTWVVHATTAGEPRCQAELPIIARGGY